jgi:competence protein ComEC
MATAFAFFVLGVVLLQQCSELPGAGWLPALAVAAVLLTAVVAALPARAGAWRRAAACAAALSAGYAYAAWIAQLRLSDQLSFDDEGRDIQVIGVVAALPTAAELGGRFAFQVQRVMRR